MTPLELQRLARTNKEWRHAIRAFGGLEGTLANLNTAFGPKENPAGPGRGSSPNHGTPNSKETLMAVAALPKRQASLALATSPPSSPKPARLGDAQQLAAWVAQGEGGVFTVTTLLTPALAALLLERNESNRPVTFGSSTRSVAVYAAAMRRGEWKLNGEALIVSRCGVLNDGQHRCHAVLEANVAVQVQITFGVDRDTRHTVDQGIARTPGHILAMSGETNSNNLACALQLLWCVDNGLSPNHRPSMDQLLETLAGHPDARDALTGIWKIGGHYRLSMGYIGAAHYLCRRVDGFSADQFLGALTTGLNIQNVNSPVARLRKQFEEHSAKRKKLDRTEQAALYIKGFNNFVRGRTGPVQWRNTGPSPEDFPLPTKRG